MAPVCWTCGDTGFTDDLGSTCHCLEGELRRENYEQTREVLLRAIDTFKKGD
jgi:hypothetical protein